MTERRDGQAPSERPTDLMGFTTRLGESGLVLVQTDNPEIASPFTIKVINASSSPVIPVATVDAGELVAHFQRAITKGTDSYYFQLAEGEGSGSIDASLRAIDGRVSLHLARGFDFVITGTIGEDVPFACLTAGSPFILTTHSFTAEIPQGTQELHIQTHQWPKRCTS